MKRMLAGHSFQALKRTLAKEYVDSGMKKGDARKIAEREGISAGSIRLWASKFFPDAKIPKREAPVPKSVLNDRISALEAKLDELTSKVEKVLEWIKS